MSSTQNQTFLFLVSHSAPSANNITTSKHKSAVKRGRQHHSCSNDGSLLSRDEEKKL